MPPLVLSEDEVQQLQAPASSRPLSHAIVQPAQMVQACGAGETNTAIAKRMGLTDMTVGKWHKRYRGPAGPATMSNNKVAEVIKRALQTQAKPSAKE